LSQFMHKSTTTHSTAAKWLFRYLKHAIFYGIHIQRNKTSKLIT
jgi:hypothetical protein